VLPFTEFIRASRAVLLYDTVGPYFYYLGLSFLGGLVLLAIGLLAFKYSEKRARRLGVLDRKVV
jgi:ABC-type polysaccharide/polyol phosphate export permease